MCPLRIHPRFYIYKYSEARIISLKKIMIKFKTTSQPVFLTFCVFSHFRVRYLRPVPYDVLKLQMDFCN